MSTFVHWLVLAGIIAGAAGLVVFLAHHFDAFVSSQDGQKAPSYAVELRRLELDLRALEHKSKTTAYTALDAEAYALLIRRRNVLVPPPSVPVRVRRPRSTAARLA